MTTLHIRINGIHLQLKGHCTLKDALDEWSKRTAASLSASGQFAIALNQHFISRTQYADTELKSGDDIELLVPMAGG